MMLIILTVHFPDLSGTCLRLGRSSPRGNHMMTEKNACIHLGRRAPFPRRTPLQLSRGRPKISNAND